MKRSICAGVLAVALLSSGAAGSEQMLNEEAMHFSDGGSFLVGVTQSTVTLYSVPGLSVVWAHTFPFPVSRRKPSYLHFALQMPPWNWWDIPHQRAMHRSYFDFGKAYVSPSGRYVAFWVDRSNFQGVGYFALYDRKSERALYEWKAPPNDHTVVVTDNADKTIPYLFLRTTPDESAMICRSGDGLYSLPDLKPLPIADDAKEDWYQFSKYFVAKPEWWPHELDFRYEDDQTGAKVYGSACVRVVCGTSLEKGAVMTFRKGALDKPLMSVPAEVRYEAPEFSPDGRYFLTKTPNNVYRLIPLPDDCPGNQVLPHTSTQHLFGK